MALQQRRVINKVEVLASGDIQVREADEIYDDAEPSVVISEKYHRYVVASADPTPDDVQAFLDNSKAT